MIRCRYCLAPTNSAFCSSECEKDMETWASNPNVVGYQPLPEFLAKPHPEAKLSGEDVYENIEKLASEAVLEKLSSPEFKKKMQEARRGVYNANW